MPLKAVWRFSSTLVIARNCAKSALALPAPVYPLYRTMIKAILRLSDVRLDLVIRRDKKKKPRVWLTPKQWKKLYAEFPAQMKSMAEFALKTGLRQANVLGLTWGRPNSFDQIPKATLTSDKISETRRSCHDLHL